MIQGFSANAFIELRQKRNDRAQAEMAFISAFPKNESALCLRRNIIAGAVLNRFET